MDSRVVFILLSSLAFITLILSCKDAAQCQQFCKPVTECYPCLQQLSCCSSLGLFATSSEDHSVKIWNTENQLVREMCFDESLRGVCFANSRGDLLVGFQSHISVVTVINYLPPSYLEILSKMHFDNDPLEEHMQFNDMLKFWYDPDRVPKTPLDASKRRSLERPEIKISRKRKKVWLGKYVIYLPLICGYYRNYCSLRSSLAVCGKWCSHAILVFFFVSESNPRN